MKPMIAAFAMLFTLVASSGLAPAQESDPVSVLKSLFEARNAADSGAALALFADDGVIINVVGVKFAGRDDIAKFLQGAGAHEGRYYLEGARAAGDTATWTDLVTNPVYEKLGVAPVQVAGEAVIRDGKIRSFVTHYPASSLAKFEQACEQQGCETPKADGVLIFGLPCLRFLENAWAQTRSVTNQ